MLKTEGISLALEKRKKERIKKAKRMQNKIFFGEDMRPPFPFKKVSSSCAPYIGNRGQTLS